MRRILLHIVSAIVACVVGALDVYAQSGGCNTLRCTQLSTSKYPMFHTTNASCSPYYNPPGGQAPYNFANGETFYYITLSSSSGNSTQCAGVDGSASCCFAGKSGWMRVT